MIVKNIGQNARFLSYAHCTVKVGGVSAELPLSTVFDKLLIGDISHGIVQYRLTPDEKARIEWVLQHDGITQVDQPVVVQLTVQDKVMQRAKVAEEQAKKRKRKPQLEAPVPEVVSTKSSEPSQPTIVLKADELPMSIDSMKQHNRGVKQQTIQPTQPVQSVQAIPVVTAPPPIQRKSSIGVPEGLPRNTPGKTPGQPDWAPDPIFPDKFGHTPPPSPELKKAGVAAAKSVLGGLV